MKPHNNSMYGRPKAGAFGLCQWGGLCFLAPPLLARNAGAVMLQAGRHRASTHKGVEVTPFHACAFAASGRPHSYWHAARPTLRPLSPALDYFRADTCVPLPSVVLCRSVINGAISRGQLTRAAGFSAARPTRGKYSKNLSLRFSSTARAPLAFAAGSPRALTLRACQTHVQRAKNWIRKNAFQVEETGRNLPAHPCSGPPKNAHPSSKRIGWMRLILLIT